MYSQTVGAARRVRDHQVQSFPLQMSQRIEIGTCGIQVKNPYGNLVQCPHSIPCKTRMMLGPVTSVWEAALCSITMPAPAYFISRDGV